jgi:hypothetical protein
MRQMGSMWVEARLDSRGADSLVLVWWSCEVGSMLGSLSVVLDQAQDLAVRRPESMPTFGATLRSQGCLFAHWSEIHPCPDPGLSYLVDKVGPSCRALSDLVDVESANPNGPDWMFIDNRLNELRHLLTKTVAVLVGRSDRTRQKFDDAVLPVDPKPGVGSGYIPSQGTRDGGRFRPDLQSSATPGSWLAARAAPS